MTVPDVEQDLVLALPVPHLPPGVARTRIFTRDRSPFDLGYPKADVMVGILLGAARRPHDAVMLACDPYGDRVRTDRLLGLLDRLEYDLRGRADDAPRADLVDVT